MDNFVAKMAYVKAPYVTAEAKEIIDQEIEAEVLKESVLMRGFDGTTASQMSWMNERPPPAPLHGRRQPEYRLGHQGRVDAIPTPHHSSRDRRSGILHGYDRQRDLANHLPQVLGCPPVGARKRRHRGEPHDTTQCPHSPSNPT